jgi:Fe-S-cluster-containing dehydrogenase component
MIAYYGYEDATGSYYLSIDDEKCSTCSDKKCLVACTQDVFVACEDDWDNEIVQVGESVVHVLRACCDICKQQGADKLDLPCLKACEKSAIRFSW